MRPLRIWKQLLGLRRTVIEEVDFDDSGEREALVVSVRPRARERDRCPYCRRRCAGYDQGEGRRRWRALDLGTTFCLLEADAPRVKCRRHGIVVAAVPWARHDAAFTRSFEDQTAWLTVNTSKTAVVCADADRVAVSLQFSGCEADNVNTGVEEYMGSYARNFIYMSKNQTAPQCGVAPWSMQTGTISGQSFPMDWVGYGFPIAAASCP